MEPGDQEPLSVATELAPFVAFRITGRRFENGGMPVEALSELIAYRSLLIEVAKDLFLQRRPHRQRVRKGFVDSFELRLVRVDSGSAVPVLERPHRTGELAIEDDEFTEARDLITDTINAVAFDRPVPSQFRGEEFSLFNRFGQSLRGDEAIELVPPADDRPRALYDREIRKRLILRGSSTYSSDISVIGRVTEINAEAETFRLRPDDNTLVTVPLAPRHFETVRAALSLEGDGPEVRVEALGVFDSDDRLERVDEVREIGPGEAGYEYLAARISELASLESGWLDGDGDPANPAVIDRVGRLIAALRTLEVPAPRLYPVPDGSVQAEWSIGTSEVSLLIEATGRAQLSSVDLATGDERDLDLDLDDDSAEDVALFVLHDEP